MKNVLLLWLASLVIVAAASVALAQTRLPESRILSGSDVGFRVEGTDRTGKPVGKWVLRLNGQWVEVGSMPTLLPVK